MKDREKMIELNWPETGLLPAIVQDIDSGRVLMLAYMNRESWAETVRVGEAIFWSRSRKEIWHKGKGSGNRQSIVRIEIDCDADTILLLVRPLGPACHTGEESCFYRQIEWGDKE